MASAARVETQRLTLGSSAPWVRRTVGPIAWAVLEALSEQGEQAGGRTVSHRSVRGLASDLSLANDTIARALNRLGDAGLLHHEADREPTGRFGSGRYVLTLPSNVFQADAGPQPEHHASRATTRRGQQPVGEQLALLADTLDGRTP